MGEAGLAFTEDDVKAMDFGILQHAGKRRTVSVRTRVIVIAVNVIYFPAVLGCVFQQHGLLILNTAAVIRFIFLVAVLFG